ncbi:MAG: NERD domain-containing protein [Oscillospiraceae bacterium]|nr:NERD domain-containing protein [Oscillospiraceae bacterium]
MNKIYRCKNANNKKIVVLLILQVFLGVAPVLLLVSFVMFKMYETKPLAIVIIGLIFACNAAYMILARRYNILNSGRNGEKNLYKAVKKLNGDNIIFVNLPIRYKRGRSEVDMLIISPKGVVIIEVKNHSGTISGNWKAEKWLQQKFYRNGKTTSIEMDNPIKQMRRQRDIVKSIFNAAGEDVWVDTVLYFSNPNVRLKLNLRENDYVCLGTKELMSSLSNYKSDRSLSKAQREKLANILNDARSNI